MIARIKGIVWESKPLQIVVDVGGVGYAVSVPLLSGLPAVGEKIELFTYAVYREDSATLYGFPNPAQRNFFTTLIEKVSGIGPKTALGLLSHISFDQLQVILEKGDINSLKAVPGVGKKTAERLLLELKGYQAVTDDSVAEGPAADAVAALISLGVSQADAQKSIARILEKNPKIGVSELVRLSLKKD